MKYRGQKRILEIGCSLGNIAGAFQRIPNIQYMGIDIDPVVIRYAQKHFASYPNFQFLCMDMLEFVKLAQQQFDYILFAAIMHHIDDRSCRGLLEAARGLISKSGILVVVDPLIPEPNDNWFMKLFLNLEQGKYVRRESDMSRLLSSVPGFQFEASEIHYIGATVFSLPICARFGLYVLSNDKS